MQNKFRTKFICKQNNISISNGMSIAVKSHCALMPLLHGNVQQTNIQNLKPDAASTVLFRFKEARIFINLFIQFWQTAESIPHRKHSFDIMLVMLDMQSDPPQDRLVLYIRDVEWNA